MPDFFFTVGAPRSGKSTWAKEYAEDHPNTVVLSADDFRYAVYNKRYQLDGEDKVRECLLIAAKALLRSGVNVILDETNSRIEHVNECLSIHPNAIGVLFLTSEEVCKKRALETYPDLIPVIDRIHSNLEILQDMMNYGLVEFKHITIRGTDEKSN